jgi:Fe-S cluster assembly protein SufD
MLNKSSRKISPMAAAAVEHYVDLSKCLNQSEASACVVVARKRAQAALLEQAFPTQRDESWQYTKLVKFVQKRFESSALNAQKTTLNKEALHKFTPPYERIQLVFVDGVLDDDLSDNLSNLPSGLHIQSTSDFVQNTGSTEPWFVEESLVFSEPFGILNTALFTDGFVLDVAENIIIELPVCVLHVQTKNSQISTLTNRVRLARNAELTLVQQFVSLTELDACSNIITSIDIAPSARMRQVVLQQQANTGFYFHNQFVSQASNSDFNTFYAGMGSVLSRHQNHLSMDGEHIENSQNSACLARQKQTVDSRTHTLHNQEWGASRQLHKYVLGDSAIGVFDGMIRVDRQAQKTDGQMDNKNLLLSNTAKMNSKPQLEIYADDVKCSHGSATGQINPDQVFYLQARGIPRSQAIEMITKAFLMEPVETINHSEVRSWIGKQVSSTLLSGGYFSGGDK